MQTLICADTTAARDGSEVDRSRFELVDRKNQGDGRANFSHLKLTLKGRNVHIFHMSIYHLHLMITVWWYSACDCIDMRETAA